jgi:hypothetical protein
LESEFEPPSNVFADQEEAAVDQPVSFSFHDAPPPEEDPPLLFVASEEEEEEDEEEEEADEFEFEFVGLLFGCLEEFESDFMTSLRADESPRLLLLLLLLLLFLSLPLLLILERWFGGVKKPPPATPIGFGGGNMFEYTWCILLDAGKKNKKFLTCLLCFVFCFFEILTSLFCASGRRSLIIHTYVIWLFARDVRKSQ